MKCRSCAGEAVGDLYGEPVCGECAAMASFAEARAPRDDKYDLKVRLVVSGPFYVNPRPIVYVPDVPTMRTTTEQLVDALKIEAAHARIMAELRRRDQDHRFFKRARLAQQLGGCRQ